jgi:acyl carrier protein
MAFTKEDTMQKTKAVIVEKLSIPIENITPESTLKDLGADSLDIVEMVMTFEEVFGIEIKDEDAEKITTVKEAADYLHAARTK